MESPGILKLRHTTCWVIHPESQDLLVWCWAQIIYQRLCSQIIYAIKAAIGLGRSSESCLSTLGIQHAYQSHSKAFETSAARGYLEARGLVPKALDRANSGNLNEFPTYTHWARAWAKTNPAYITQQPERTQAGVPVPLFLPSFPTKISCGWEGTLRKSAAAAACHLLWAYSISSKLIQSPQNWPNFLKTDRPRASC